MPDIIHQRAKISFAPGGHRAAQRVVIDRSDNVISEAIGHGIV
jgi:hypothetical protein